MKELVLTIGGEQINAPANVPSGNLFNTGQSAIQGIFGMIFIIAVFFAFGSIILAGIRWVMSEGKKENIETIKNQIVYTLIGLVLILVSFAIVKIIGFSMGVPLFSGG